MPPLALLYQLYCLVSDRTQVDRELSSLQQQNILRVFKLFAGSDNDELCVARTEDYERSIRAMITTTGGKSTPPTLNNATEKGDKDTTTAAGAQEHASDQQPRISPPSISSSAIHTLRSMAPFPSSSNPPAPATSNKPSSASTSSSTAAAVASPPVLSRPSSASMFAPWPSSSSASPAVPSTPSTVTAAASARPSSGRSQLSSTSAASVTQISASPAATAASPAIKTEPALKKGMVKRKRPAGAASVSSTSSATAAASSSSVAAVAASLASAQRRKLAHSSPPPSSTSPAAALSAPAAASSGAPPVAPAAVPSSSSSVSLPRPLNVPPSLAPSALNLADTLTDDRFPALASTSHSSHFLVEDANLLLDLFVTHLLPACKEISITRERLLELVYLPHAHLFRSMTSDQCISCLVHKGLLLFKSASSFYFAPPGLSRLLVALRNGRKELVAIVRRRQYKELLLRELLTRPPLKTSPCRVEFHLRDMLGSQTQLQLVETGLGPLVKIVVNE